MNIKHDLLMYDDFDAPSSGAYSLAEMIMSDCGCSSNNHRLLDRIAERIQRFSEATVVQPARISKQELHVLTLTVDCWNAWCKLPENTTDDNEEFMRAIHAAQNMIALRVARRADPDAWRQPGPQPVKPVGPSNLILKGCQDLLKPTTPPTSEGTFHA